MTASPSPPPPNPNSNDELNQLAATFHSDGYLLLPQLFSRSFTSLLLKECSALFESVLSHLCERGETEFASPSRLVRGGGRSSATDEAEADERPKGAAFEYPLKRGAKNGYREIVMRSPGRYEVALLAEGGKGVLSPEMFGGGPAAGSSEGVGALDRLVRWIRDDVDDSRSVERDDPPRRRSEEERNLRTLLAAIRAIFRPERYSLINLSLVVSTPGCPPQPWHSDGPHSSLSRHLPAHALNVFVPLVDVPPSMGPTELRPGSHYYTRDLAKSMLGAMARKELRKSAVAEMRGGDALLFDWRILHRGRGNESHLEEEGADRGANVAEENACSFDRNHGGRDRPILVLTLAKSWFVDVCNFPKRSIFALGRSDEG